MKKRARSIAGNANYRKIWEEHNRSTIPAGWHVHHLDGNRKNNNPRNLICVSPETHQSIHALQGDPVALAGKFVHGAAAAGKKNAELHFSSERQSKYAQLGPAAQLALGTHISQNKEICSYGGKRAAELGRSGLMLPHVRLAGARASGRLAAVTGRVAEMGRKGGKISSAGPNAFWKTGGLAKAAAKSQNNVNKQFLRCCDHGIIGTVPGMKRYHKNCNLVKVENV